MKLLVSANSNWRRGCIVKMLQDAQQNSRLCQDILELERDFKYNLFLLELKDKEIER